MLQTALAKAQTLYKKHQTFVRYVIVGGSGTFVDLFSLYVLTESTGINPQTDMLFNVFVAIAFLLACSSNYILNRVWTFESKDTNISGEFFRFLVVSIGGFIATQLLMELFVSVLLIHYMFSKALTSILVLIWNFSLNKFWTFKVPQNTAPKELRA